MVGGYIKLPDKYIGPLVDVVSKNTAGATNINLNGCFKEISELVRTRKRVIISAEALGAAVYGTFTVFDAGEIITLTLMYTMGLPKFLSITVAASSPDTLSIMLLGGS